MAGAAGVLVVKLTCGTVTALVIVEVWLEAVTVWVYEIVVAGSGAGAGGAAETLAGDAGALLLGGGGMLRVMVLGTAVTMPGLDGIAAAQIPAKNE